MWPTIALYGSGLLLALAILCGAVWIGKRWGRSEVRRVIAEDEAERRARDAEIAAMPAGKRPLDELFR